MLRLGLTSCQHFYLNLLLFSISFLFIIVSIMIGFGVTFKIFMSNPSYNYFMLHSLGSEAS